MSFKLIFFVIPASKVTNSTQPTLVTAYPRWVKDCRKCQSYRAKLARGKHIS